MRYIRLQTAALLPGLFCAIVAYAQQPQPTAAVPKLVRFSGSFRPAEGTPAQTLESVTLSVYRDQTGGDALWHELQNVVVDMDGHYSVLMGATQNDGMPLDLFTSSEPRWLGVQFNRPGEVEQSRVLLVSVPYALKAADADTLGGKPASAYLLAAPSVGTDPAGVAGVTAVVTNSAGVVKPRAIPANSGLPNYIGKFVNTTDLIDSAMYEVSGNVGISTTTPGISLDVRTGSLPQIGIAGTKDYLTFFASDTYGPAIYWDPAKDMRFGKGGTALYSATGFVEQMRIQSSTGRVGIGTSTPVAKLDVSGNINFSGNVLYQGSSALQFPGNLTDGNVAVGVGALTTNTTGVSNTATGFDALMNNTTGFRNTATGEFALQSNTIGNENTAVGWAAGYNGVSGNQNISIGYYAGTSVASGNSYNIDIGNVGSSGDSGIIRIGDSSLQSKFFVAGVRGVTTGSNDAIEVMIDSNGQLGTKSSSRRFKEDIADMGAASRDLMRLRPVTYRYKEPFADGSKPIQYGLIAEEVSEVYPDLVAHSADGQIETVKYQVLDSMLLNEVQRQQVEIRRLEQRNQSLEERLAKLEAALAAGPVGSRLTSDH